MVGYALPKSYDFGSNPKLRTKLDQEVRIELTQTIFREW